MAPDKEPDLFLQIENIMLAKNMLMTHIIAGIAKNVHLLLIKTNPKCDIWVKAKDSLLRKINGMIAEISMIKPI
jgi:hypothetical protein